MEKLKKLFHNKKVLLVISAMIVSIVGLYYFIVYRPEHATDDGSTEEDTNTARPYNPTKSPDPVDYTKVDCPTYANNTMAQEGSKCKYVAQLQRYLNKHKGAGLVVDGQWGPGTQKAFLKAAFPIDGDATKVYATLTKNLYNKLGLINY